MTLCNTMSNWSSFEPQDQKVTFSNHGAICPYFYKLSKFQLNITKCFIHVFILKQPKCNKVKQGFNLTYQNFRNWINYLLFYSDHEGNIFVLLLISNKCLCPRKLRWIVLYLGLQHYPHFVSFIFWDYWKSCI